MTYKIKNLICTSRKDSGFIKSIILIIIALLLIRYYFGVTFSEILDYPVVSGVIDWFKTLFNSVPYKNSI